MKIVGIVFGALLIVLALSSIPGVLAQIGKKDDAFVTGQFAYVGCEGVGGALLVFYCIRGLIRESNKPRTLAIDDFPKRRPRNDFTEDE